MYLESAESVPEDAAEEDKLNFRDNLKYAMQHTNRSMHRNILERRLQVNNKNSLIFKIQIDILN